VRLTYLLRPISSRTVINRAYRPHHPRRAVFGGKSVWPRRSRQCVRPILNRLVAKLTVMMIYVSHRCQLRDWPLDGSASSRRTSGCELNVGKGSCLVRTKTSKGKCPIREDRLRRVGNLKVDGCKSLHLVPVRDLSVNGSGG
jgi:hypothetical protein